MRKYIRRRQKSAWFYRFSPAKRMHYGVKGLNLGGGIVRFVFWVGLEGESVWGGACLADIRRWEIISAVEEIYPSMSDYIRR